MSEITRKKDTGEPGNGGQFGTVARVASGLDLPGRPTPSEEFVGAYNTYGTDDYLSTLR